MMSRIADAHAKNDWQPLTTEQLRKAGYTPPGFKSSQPKPRSP